MVFADALYFLLGKRGFTQHETDRHVETNLDELTQLTGLTSKTLRKMIDGGLSQPEPFRLRQNQGFAAHTFTFGFDQYEEQFLAKYARKPFSYLQQNWCSTLALPYPNAQKSSRFPLAILNVFWRKPNGKVIRFSELSKRIQKPNSTSPPDPLFVHQALEHLQKLELITQVDSGGYRFQREQLSQDGYRIWQHQVLHQQSKASEELIEWGQAQNPKLAQVAQELIRLGNYDFDTNFRKIFNSLSLVRLETDLPWLQYAVKRHRHRPATADRWAKCWKLYENSLAANQTRQQSAKVKLYLKDQVEHVAVLKLESIEKHTLRWGKIVIWVNDKRQQLTGYGHNETILTMLQKGKRLVWQRELTDENELVRFDLTADMQQDLSDICYRLKMRASAPLPQVKIEAQIEAEFLKPSD